MSPRHLARVHVRGSSGHPRCVAQQRLQHRRLACAVAADQDDSLAAIDDRVHAGNDVEAAERFLQPLELEGHLAGRPLHRKLDVWALDVRARQLGRLQPLDLLAARRRLACASAGAEALDEVVELRDLLLALRVVRFDS